MIRKSASKAFVILKQAIEFEELVQIGRIEFQKFVNWYDPGKARFGTYLMNYLHLRIILEARKQLTVVHVPAKVHGQVKDINNARNKLLKDLKREPADIELAEALGITIYELHTRISLTRLNIYLDEPIFEDDESYTRYNLLKGEKFPSPEEVLAKKNLRYSIELAIENSNLDDREKRFIRLYWFEGHVYKDIGAMEKKPLSVERVRQVIQDAFEKIRKGPYGDVLRDIYFDE